MTTKGYKEYIIEQFQTLNKVTIRPMMGEYLLYYNGILFGGIYDDRLLVKKVASNKKYNMESQIPYNNAKEMYMVSDIEDIELLHNIVIDTCKDLSNQ